MGLRIRYGLSTDYWYVETTGINEWTHSVKYAVMNYAFRFLKSQCKENNKLKISVLKHICSQNTWVLKARLRMYDVKENFKIKYGFDLNCPFCRKEVETLQHILQCDCVPFVKHKTGISANVDTMRNAMRWPLAREGGKLTDNYVLNIFVIIFY